MGTVYSLVCWGGKDGKAVTAASPSTHRFTLASNGLRTGSAIIPQSSFGGLTAGTTYYANVTKTGATINEFYVCDSLYNAQNDITRTLVATIGIFKSKVMLDYFAANPGRWGASGSERVYPSVPSALSSRNTATVLAPSFDTEFIEVGEAFTELGAGQWSIVQWKCLRVTLSSMVAGVRSSAFHKGRSGTGFVAVIANGSAVWVDTGYFTLDGLEVEAGQASCTLISDGATTHSIMVKNNIFKGFTGGTYQRGCYIGNTGEIHHNIFYNMYGATGCGMYAKGYGGLGLRAYHNTITKCAVGIQSEVGSQGDYYNNIVVGNTVNYGALPAYSSHKSANNIGEVSDRKDFTVGVGTNLITVPSGHTRGTAVPQIKFFNVGGTLPTVSGSSQPTLIADRMYYIRSTPTAGSTMTISDVPTGGTIITFSDAGTGTHYFHTTWFTLGSPIILSTPATNIFVNDTTPPYDFSPPSKISPQVDSALVIEGWQSSDITDGYAPDYSIDTFPNDKFDVGAVEFKHLDSADGHPPQSQSFVLNGISSNSRVKITDVTHGTVIYNGIPGATALTVNTTNGGDVVYQLDVRTGSTAPFYYAYRETGTYYAVGGQNRTISLIPDIARGSSYRAGIASDWNPLTLAHIAGTTVDTVQDLYSWLCDYYDDAATVDLPIPLYGTTPEIFGTQNGATITDADHRFLKGGSLQEGSTLWSNVYTVGSQAAGTPIYVHLDGVLLTSFWPTGNIDILVKCVSGAARLVDVRAHNYGDTYDHWQMTVGAGRNVAAISTTTDPNNSIPQATINAAPYNTITVTVDNPVAYKIDASDTAGNYTTTVDWQNLPGPYVYNRLKNITASPSTYVSANSAWPEVKVSPYATFSAGKVIGARGVRFINVPTADALNYTITDNAGVTHSAAVPPVSLTVTNIVSGSRLQLYDLTTSTELYNGIVNATSYSLTFAYPGTDHDIRIRISRVSGATALAWYETQGSATTSGMNVRAAQVADAVYNAIAIDGSTVTECSIVGTVLKVNITDPDNITTWSRIYAFECYWLFTAGGIRDQDLFITATDPAHYIFEGGLQVRNMKIGTPLSISGGFAVDQYGSALALLDLTGGMIFTASTEVVPFAYSSGSGLDAGQAAKLNSLFNGLTAEQERLVKLSAAANAGKVSGAAGTTIVIRDVADTVNAITATVDADGNRTAITYGI